MIEVTSSAIDSASIAEVVPVRSFILWNQEEGDVIERRRGVQLKYFGMIVGIVRGSSF